MSQGEGHREILSLSRISLKHREEKSQKEKCYAVKQKKKKNHIHIFTDTTVSVKAFVSEAITFSFPFFSPSRSTHTTTWSINQRACALMAPDRWRPLWAAVQDCVFGTHLTTAAQQVQLHARPPALDC